MRTIRDLYWLLRHDWKVHYFLPALLIFPVLVFFSRDPFLTYYEPGEPLDATITSMGVGSNRFQGRTPGYRVSARTADGIRGSTIVLPKRVEGCEVGDRIRAEKVGMKLYLKPAPCDEASAVD
ncbi:hypothetical protein T8S45_10760 [Blastomonas marina]|uniref:hypothetical protein n=1 Tax=Blastomonas marina TaxID=1867408 RepID=UPI002AC89D5C|nr:hypothetical protein [Blastomonas marina]WPZ03306.1 hypothetical protein T8S45_10760 [Blastomonas marina]